MTQPVNVSALQLANLAKRHIDSKDKLDQFLRVFFGVYLSSVAIEPGNSSPLDFVWDIYSTALGMNPDPVYSFVGMAARGSQKTLAFSVIETLLLGHDTRSIFSMASIKEQAAIAYAYTQRFLSRPFIKDFAKKPPLKGIVEGVNGNVLKIGSATMDQVNSFHGCIYGESLVNFNSSTTTLSKIYKQTYRPSEIESHPSFRQFTNIKYSGKQECLKITTDIGNEIILTPDHNSVAFGEQGFYKKSAKDFVVGDYLFLKINGGFPASRDRFSRIYSKQKCTNENLLSVSNYDDLCYLMGIILGDGFVDGEEFYLGTGYECDLSQVLEILKRVTGYAGNEFSLEQKNSNSQIIRSYSQQVLNDFKSLDLNFKTSIEKDVPDWIMSSPKESFYHFISGYFDSDGSSQIRKNRDNDSPLVLFYSCSEKLLQKIQFLLFRGGHVGTIYHSKKEGGYDAYQLSFSSESAISLAKEIIKHTKLNKDQEKYKSLLRISKSRMVFPQEEKIDEKLVWDLFKKIRAYHHGLVKSKMAEPIFEKDGQVTGKNSVFRNHGEIGFQRIKDQLAQYWEASECSEWKTLYELTHSNSYPVKVKSVEKLEGAHDVYDVQVEDGRIWAPNGIKQFNSVFQDEIELTDEIVFKESRGMLTAERGKMPLSVYISSRKFAFGNLQRILDAAEIESMRVGRPSVKIHKWGILEATDKCLPDRSGNLNTTPLYVDEDNLIAIEEGDYLIKNPKQQSSYKRFMGHDNCFKCGIFSFCLGRLVNQKDDNPYLQPIETAKDNFLHDDVVFFKSQRLNRKPSQMGLVYPMFDETIHMKDFNAMYEILTGKPAGQFISRDKFISTLLDHGGGLFLGVDFGWHVAAVVMLAAGPDDKVYIVADKAYNKQTHQELATALKKDFGKYPIERVFPDYESQEAIKQLRQCGFPVPDEGENVNKDREEGAAVVRNLLRIPGTLETNLYVASDLISLRDEFRFYRHKIDKKTGEPTDEIEKGNDHRLDALRYVIISIFGRTKTRVSFGKATEDKRDKFIPFSYEKPLRPPTGMEMMNLAGTEYRPTYDEMTADPASNLKKRSGFTWSF